MDKAGTIARIRKIVVVAACCLYAAVGAVMALTHPRETVQPPAAPEQVVMKGNFLREAFAEMPPEGVDANVTKTSPLGPAASFAKSTQPMELAEVVPDPAADIKPAKPDAHAERQFTPVSKEPVVHHDYCYPGHRVDYGRHWRCVYAHQSRRHHRHG